MRCTSSIESSPLMRRMNSMLLGTPGRIRPHRLHVFRDRQLRRRIVPGQRQMHDARRQHEIVQIRNAALRTRPALPASASRRSTPRVVMNLQRADARRDIDNARQQSPRAARSPAHARGSADSDRARSARTRPADTGRHRRGRRSQATVPTGVAQHRLFAHRPRGSAGKLPVERRHACLQLLFHRRCLLERNRAEANQIAGLAAAPSSTARPARSSPGQTKPPRLGPSGPRITGMSPVKSTVPMA